MTRDESNRTSESRAFGATDNDDSTPHGEVSLQKLFFVGITLPEHKWIILRERRGTSWMPPKHFRLTEKCLSLDVPFSPDDSAGIELSAMHLKFIGGKKDAKGHCYFNIVESLTFFVREWFIASS